MQRTCQRCGLPGNADEGHFVFECSALQSVRDSFANLFGDGKLTMQLQQLLWKASIVQVAHIIQACSAELSSPVGGCGSSHQPKTAGTVV